MIFKFEHIQIFLFIFYILGKTQQKKWGYYSGNSKMRKLFTSKSQEIVDKKDTGYKKYIIIQFGKIFDLKLKKVIRLII